MYSNREVFPDAPLELVAAEIRFPYAPRLRKQSVIDEVLQDLTSELPVLRKQRQITITVNGSDVGQKEEVPRLFNRSFTTSAVISPTAVTIETTSYEDFSNFRALVLKVVESVAKHGSVAAAERIGLRYIDEIRVPALIEDVRDWQKWVSADFVRMIDMAGDCPSTSAQGQIEYKLPHDNMHLVFRYAAVHGKGVVGSDPLQRRHPFEEPEPFFVLDFDSFYRPDLEFAPEFSSYIVGETLDSLHTPAGATFQRVITDRLRELFRGGR